MKSGRKKTMTSVRILIAAVVSIIIQFALAIAGWGGWRGVLLTASLLVPLVARIRAEEHLLRSHFGAEYDAYCVRTWRLLPGIY
jgi:protein-S-isoprenylcysteine O-methyltransferase Ste14